jgi:hypothetical protein
MCATLSRKRRKSAPIPCFHRLETGSGKVSFQLVRASDSDIAVWETEQGHIYVFAVSPHRDVLMPQLVRAAPDATEPAERFTEEALRFATQEAESRKILVTQAAKTRSALA